jgi:hypothetical protein
VNVLFVLGGLRVGGYELLTARLANALVDCRVAAGIVSLTEQLAQRVLTLAIDDALRVAMGR